jgi:hypothetical protein
MGKCATHAQSLFIISHKVDGKQGKPLKLRKVSFPTFVKHPLGRSYSWIHLKLKIQNLNMGKLLFITVPTSGYYSNED